MKAIKQFQAEKNRFDIMMAKIIATNFVLAVLAVAVPFIWRISPLALASVPVVVYLSGQLGRLIDRIIK